MGMASRRLCLALAPVCLLALVVTDCSFLVSFDTMTDAGADGGGGGGCDAAACVPPFVDATVPVDVTLGWDASDEEAQEQGDAEPPDDVEQLDVTIPDVIAPFDVGDCATLPDGAACGKPTACSMTATCQSGACVLVPLPDGTSCGTAPNACSTAPVCASGVCVPSAAMPDGTSCGAAPNACQTESLCMSGACVGPTPVADGTACGAAPDACHLAPTCSGGTCGSPANAPDGTTCGSAPNACHDAPKCSSGTCAAAASKSDGTQWMSGDNNARCCGGSPVETTSNSNCGVCGWACKDGTSCNAIDGEYLCTGCLGGGDCASGCCSESPAPNHCSPSNCSGACQSPDVCTDGSHCVVGANVDYCTY